MPPINTADLEAAVTEAEGVDASVEAFISGFGAKMTQAVTDALNQDAAANQASVDAANAAIAAVTARVKASTATLAAGITA